MTLRKEQLLMLIWMIQKAMVFLKGINNFIAVRLEQSLNINSSLEDIDIDEDFELNNELRK